MDCNTAWCVWLFALPIEKICTNVAAFLTNPLYNKLRPVIPRRLSSQHPFTSTFHLLWSAVTQGEEAHCELNTVQLKMSIGFNPITCLLAKIFLVTMSFQEKDTILSPFLDKALFKCQIVLGVSSPDFEVWTSVENKNEHTTSKSLSSRPKLLLCSVCGRLSQASHSKSISLCGDLYISWNTGCCKRIPYFYPHKYHLQYQGTLAKTSQSV